MKKIITQVRIEEHICDICGNKKIVNISDNKPREMEYDLDYSKFVCVKTLSSAVVYDLCPSCTSKIYNCIKELSNINL